MNAKRLIPLAFTAILLLGACRGRHSSALSAESHAPGTTLARTPAACQAYPAGAPGVIRTFCNGPAKVNLTVAGVTHPLAGGVCRPSDGAFNLDLGVVSGPDLAGPKPDHVGLTAPVAAGAFNGATLAVTVDGKAYAVRRNDGQVSPAGGSFEGVADSGEVIKADFTC